MTIRVTLEIQNPQQPLFSIGLSLCHRRSNHFPGRRCFPDKFCLFLCGRRCGLLHYCRLAGECQTVVLHSEVKFELKK